MGCDQMAEFVGKEYIILRGQTFPILDVEYHGVRSDGLSVGTVYYGLRDRHGNRPQYHAKVCLRCGTPISWANKKRKFCSHYCATHHWHENNDPRKDLDELIENVPDYLRKYLD
jgi:hypothetical protein